MNFDAQAIFANLAEKERVKGHRSPEGRAIRTLSRALSGWLAKNLSDDDVVVLCDQAVEDWLKARLKVSPWSAKSRTELPAKAVEMNLVTKMEALSLQRIHHLRVHSSQQTVGQAEVEAALESCMQTVDRHWS
jgi:hypothetical protein